MVERPRGPSGLAAALLLLISLVAACGESSGKPDGAATFNFSTSYSVFLQSYLALGISDVDRAYAYCFGPNDPKPVSTPLPDPSGHSRAQVSCLEAAGQAAAKLPAYKEVVTKFQASTAAPTRDSRINNARSALLKVHDARIKLYEEAATAAARNDAAATAALAVRYKDIATLSEASEKAVQAISQPVK